MRTCTESPEEVASCPSSGSRWSPSPTRCTPVRAMCKYIFLLSPKRFCGWYLTLLVGPLVCCSMRSPLSVECHIRRCLPVISCSYCDKVIGWSDRRDVRKKCGYQCLAKYIIVDHICLTQVFPDGKLLELRAITQANIFRP